MELRSTTPDDLLALRRFYARQGRKDTCVVHDDFYDWQFIRPLALVGRTDSSFLAAFNHGEAIAIAAATPGNFLSEGNLVVGCWHQELIAEKSAAAYFLMKRQAELNNFLGAATQNIDSAVVLDGVRKFIWIELERLFTVIDAKKTQNFIFQPTARTSSYLRNCGNVKQASPRATWTPIDRFDEAYNSHWDEIRNGFSFVLDRNSVFMNWRYVDHPILVYHRYRCQAPAGIVYYVWRNEMAKGKDGIIARICEVIGSPEAIAQTFPTLHEFLCNTDIAFADFSCTNGEINAALVHGGMHPLVLVAGTNLARLLQPVEDRSEKRINFCFSFCEKTTPKDIFNYHRAYVTRGDANQDRPLP